MRDAPWGQSHREQPSDGEPIEMCDVCGATEVVWRKCKLICLNCGTILKSCADL